MFASANDEAKKTDQQVKMEEEAQHSSGLSR